MCAPAKLCRPPSGPYLWITLASAVFALGFDWCYVPNQITLGGMTGLGQIIHAIVPAIPVGSAVIALNLPLFLLGWRLLGWKLLASSLFATAATSLGVDLHWPPVPLLPAHGPHAGLRLRRRADRAVPWDGVPPGSHHRRHRSHRPAAEAPLRPSAHGHPGHGGGPGGHRPGRSGLPQPEQRPVRLVSLYISSFVIDQVLYGMDNAKVAYIISDRPQEIIRSISTELDRGVTILQGGGPGPGRQKTCSCAPSSRSRSWP